MNALYQDGEINLGHDIALIKLETEFDFEENVCLSCEISDFFNSSSDQVLPFNIPTVFEEYASNLECLVVGNGMLLNGSSSHQLQVKSVELLVHEECSQTYGTVPPNTVCASEGSCFGDSGGPLLCKTRGIDNDFSIFGVTSYTQNSCLSPANAYTSVSTYVDWVAEKLREFGVGGSFRCDNLQEDDYLNGDGDIEFFDYDNSEIRPHADKKKMSLIFEDFQNSTLFFILFP